MGVLASVILGVSISEADTMVDVVVVTVVHVENIGADVTDVVEVDGEVDTTVDVAVEVVKDEVEDEVGDVICGAAKLTGGLSRAIAGDTGSGVGQ